jgi:NAD(P)-dependent dehydrogenase (short-subunit alcohol dehydrogenase family)
MSEFRGNVLVAGASRGIGEQIARQLSASGYKVILASRSATQIEAIARELPSAVAAPFDLSKLEEIPAWFESLVAAHGAFSGLVCCAGLYPVVPLKNMSLGQMEETFRINTLAPMLLTQAFRKPGAHKPPASVVMVASIMGLVGQSGLTLYSASKAALLGFVRSAALELARQKIRVNAVAPGVIETEPVKQLFATLSEPHKNAIIAAHALGIGDTSDVADAVEFLLCEKSKWITGTTLVLDGGYTAQ